MRDPYDSSRDFIKRIVGVPGDRVLIRQATFTSAPPAQGDLHQPEAWTENADWPLGEPAIHRACSCAR